MYPFWPRLSPEAIYPVLCLGCFKNGAIYLVSTTFQMTCKGLSGVGEPLLLPAALSPGKQPAAEGTSPSLLQLLPQSHTLFIINRNPIVPLTSPSLQSPFTPNRNPPFHSSIKYSSLFPKHTHLIRSGETTGGRENIAGESDLVWVSQAAATSITVGSATAGLMAWLPDLVWVSREERSEQQGMQGSWRGFQTWCGFREKKGWSSEVGRATVGAAMERGLNWKASLEGVVAVGAAERERARERERGEGVAETRRRRGEEEGFAKFEP